MPAPPDRTAFLDDPKLLERALMGLRLHELIAELAPAGASAPRGQAAPAAAALSDVLAGDEDNLLERGLVALSRARLDALLGQPALLLELQELLLARGGSYWDQVTGSLPGSDGVQLSEGQWQERLEQTFARRPKAKSPSGAQQPAPTPMRGRSFWARRRDNLVAALLIGVAALGMAAAWYRAEARLAAAQRQHTDETAALQSGFDARLAALQQEQAGERAALYCRVLDELSSLPPPEQLVSLPADAAPRQADGLPPDEDLLAEEHLPAAEEALISPSAREQAIARVAEALREDAAVWAELTGDAGQYLEHADPRVSHGAAMALGKTNN